MKKTLSESIKLPEVMMSVVTVVKDAAASLPLMDKDELETLAEQLNPRAVRSFIIYRCSIWPDRKGDEKGPQGFRAVADCSHYYAEAREMFAYLVSRSRALQKLGSDFRHDLALVMRVPARDGKAVHAIDCATGQPMEWRRNGESVLDRQRGVRSLVMGIQEAAADRPASIGKN